MRALPSRQEGFTLLEVLVAFVILTSTMIIGSRVFSEGLTRLNETRRHERAALIAQREISLLKLSPRLSPATTRGSEDGYTWHTTLSPLATPEKDTVIPFKVVVRVGWDEEADRTVIEVESVLLAVAED